MGIKSPKSPSATLPPAPAVKPKVTKITATDKFKEITSSDKSFVIEYCAPWQEPCKELSKKFDEYSTASKYADKFEFYRVDICDSQDVAMDSGVKDTPTYHFYKAGAKEDEFTGTTYNALERSLGKWANAV